jgi:hypothetical protein
VEEGIEPLLGSRAEHVWQDALCINPDTSIQPAEDSSGAGNSQLLEYLGHWEFCNPGRILKKKSRTNRQNSKEKSKDSRNRFTSKIPHHKKADIVEDLAWTMNQTDMLCSGGANGGTRLRGSTPAASGGPASMGPPGSARGAGNEGGSGGGGVNSPASLGTPVSVMTPKAHAPGSVRTPGDPASLMSPHQPASNGPLTPMDTDAGGRPPRTPKSVPPPSYSIASPYTSVKSVEKKPDIVKQEDVSGGGNAAEPMDVQQTREQQIVKQEPASEPSNFGPTAAVAAATANALQPRMYPVKRPMLPLKEYEMELLKEDNLSDIIYDYQALQHWLNHPVKKFRPSDSRGGDPKRPMYRRNSQADMFEAEKQSMVVKQEPQDDEQQHNSTNGATSEQSVKKENVNNGGNKQHQQQQQTNGIAENGDPYEFSDGNVSIVAL